jgi:transcriptional regulator with XRE-family HTH domain
MDSGLTPAAAKDLGRAFRHMRKAWDLTYRDAAKASGVSAQYIMNVDHGQKANVSEAVYRAMATAYKLPPDKLDNLLLRARLLSALERRGLTLEQSHTLLERLSQSALRMGIDLETDITEDLRPMYAGERP